MSSAVSTKPGKMPSQGLLSSLRLAAMDIKLAHSIFAMPFAILASFLATPAARTVPPAGAWQTFILQLALIVPCMVFARTWAMLINRLADRDFDAKNERTARRLIASGALPLIRARAITAGAASAFIACCGLFLLVFGNPWPLALSVPVLGWIALYSYTKRFTALCHVFLGGALGFSPLAAALAVDPASALSASPIWWIALFVVLWVAGFDVLYAIQDIDFDRSTGLRSIPSRVGLAGALWISRLLHACAFVALVLAARSDPRFGVLFHGAVGFVAVLLVVEHAVVATRGKAGIPMAFFTINGIVSCVLGVAGCLDLTIV